MVIPYGTAYGYGRVQVRDFDRDGYVDLIFTWHDWNTYRPYICYIEVLSDSYNLVDTLYLGGMVWGSGDFDNDGLYDIVTSYGGPVIYESPDSFSYPKNEVWRDTVDFGVVIPSNVHDVDGDSFLEIFYPVGEPDTIPGYWIIWAVTESDSDNSYRRRLFEFHDNMMSIASTFAFSDFDGDGLVEFVYGDIDGYYSVFECVGDDLYERVRVSQLPTANIFDCFAVGDMDLDGRLEFIVKGFIYPWNQYNVFIFEAIGDNQYQIKKQLDYDGPGNDNIMSYSCSGDVDSDSIEEAILLTQPWIRILKANGNDNFYVWDSIYIGPYGGSVAVYDIDGNGINEIIWSGNNITKIYEWDGTDIKENPGIPDFEYPISNIVGAVSLPRKYKIFNVTGRLIATRKSLLQKGLKKGIYFIKTKGKTFKIIKIK